MIFRHWVRFSRQNEMLYRGSFQTAAGCIQPLIILGERGKYRCILFDFGMKNTRGSIIKCWLKGNATTAIIVRFFTHWAFPGKLGVMYVICLIFLTAALIPRAFRPHGKPAVPFEYVGSPLIYGTGGPNQAGNASPLPTNYSIAATPLSFSRQFIFVIRNISEVRKRFSNGYLNKPAEQIPIVGGA